MICVICLEEGNVTRGNGTVHYGRPGLLCQPVHKACLDLWIETQGRPICPICRDPIRISTIFNWKDRVIKILPTKRAIATGMVSGLALRRELGSVSLGMGSGLAVSGFMRLVKHLFKNCCPSLNFREVTGTVLGGLTGICGTVILYSKFIGWEGTLEKFSKETDELSEDRMRIPTSPLLIQVTFTLGSLGA